MIYVGERRIAPTEYVVVTGFGSVSVVREEVVEGSLMGDIGHPCILIYLVTEFLRAGVTSIGRNSRDEGAVGVRMRAKVNGVESPVQLVS